MRSLSKPREADITGCFLAIDLAPVFVTIQGRDFLAIFSTEDKLRESMTFHKVTNYSILQIRDGERFLDQLWSHHVQVVLDPHIHEGNRRFTLVVPNTRQQGRG